MPKKSGLVKKIALGAVGLYVGSAAVVGVYQGITGTGDEPETEIVMEAPEIETEEPQTFAVPEPDPETTAETETETEGNSAIDSLLAGLSSAVSKLTETAPPETKPAETKAPETKPPETKAPETKPAETKPPETKAQETTKPITITHSDSSLSPELVQALEGVAAFWAPNGTKIHLNPFCRSFQGTVYAGTVAEANSVKDGGWCGTCSKYANENTKTNTNATPSVIADCYSYTDYLNKIPAEAFD